MGFYGQFTVYLHTHQLLIDTAFFHQTFLKPTYSIQQFYDFLFQPYNYVGVYCQIPLLT